MTGTPSLPLQLLMDRALWKLAPSKEATDPVSQAALLSSLSRQLSGTRSGDGGGSKPRSATVPPEWLDGGGAVSSCARLGGGDALP